MLQFFAPDVVLGYIQQGPGYLIGKESGKPN